MGVLMVPSETAFAASGVLDGEGLGGELQSALGQRGQDGGDPGVGVVDQARGDVDDVTTALGEHPLDGQLVMRKKPARFTPVMAA
jgi:hypothetical protein